MGSVSIRVIDNRIRQKFGLSRGWDFEGCNIGSSILVWTECVGIGADHLELVGELGWAKCKSVDFVHHKHNWFD